MSPEGSKTLETSPLGSKSDQKGLWNHWNGLGDVAAPGWATCQLLGGPHVHIVAKGGPARGERAAYDSTSLWPSAARAARAESEATRPWPPGRVKARDESGPDAPPPRRRVWARAASSGIRFLFWNLFWNPYKPRSLYVWSKLDFVGFWKTTHMFKEVCEGLAMVSVYLTWILWKECLWKA